MKTCTQCQIEKDEAEFHKDKRSKDCHCNRCKVCACAAGKIWRSNNEVVINAKKRIKYGEDPNKYREEKRRSYNKHRDQRLIDTKKYHNKHPEVNKESCRKHRRINAALIKDRHKNWRRKNNTLLLENREKRKISITTEYVRGLLRGQGFPSSEITQDLIELKKAHILFKRLKKTKT